MKNKNKINTADESANVAEGTANAKEDLTTAPIVDANTEEKAVYVNIDKNKNKAKKVNKSISKANLIITISVVIFGIVSGGFIGDYLIQKNRSNEVNYNVDEYQEELGTTQMKWENLQKKNASKLEDELTAVEFVQIAILETQKQNYLCEGFGITKAGSLSTQNVTSIKAKINDKSYFESVSGGAMAQIATRYVGSNNTINKYTSEAKNIVKEASTDKVDIYLATYTKQEEMTYEKYEETFGASFTSLVDYVIYSKTIDTNTEPSVKVENGNYHISLSLNDDATPLYKKKIAATEDRVDSVSEFFFVNLDFVLDSSLRIKEMNIVERYKMYAFNIPITCDAFLDANYFYDDINENIIPNMNEEYSVRSDLK